MKLTKIEINNFKSFGECDNTLFIDKLNVIVGKNESGKSNIIDAISEIGTVGLTPESYFQHKNRNINADVYLKLYFDKYPKESRLNETTIIDIKNYNNYLISGGLSTYIKNDSYFNTLFTEIIDLNESNLSFTQTVFQNRTNQLIEMLSRADKQIFIEPEYFNDFLNALTKSSNDKHKILASKLKDISNALDDIYCLFPTIIKIENFELKSRYTLKNIQEDDLLGKFLEICDINIEEIISAMQMTDTSDIRNFEKDINKKIAEKFTALFNKFYSQENISIELVINSSDLCIMIDTSNRYLNYDERSNGLKWYLNIFIQLLYMDREYCESTKNNIILIDEPGVYLHPNAQKELYSLFNNLTTTKENQIIFTTHSPFMINSDELQNIRAVIKDDKGFSHIYNKITTIPSENNSTYDTITPLLYTLGLDLDYNIGPNFKTKNIIVEGISDYLYLQSYFNIKKIKKSNRPNIIPSTGANNILAISSILYGWGCDFLILLDQDDKGRQVYDSFNDSNHPFIEKILFINGSTEKNQQTHCEIEDLFSDIDKNKFGINEKDYNDKKYNYSYSVYNSIIQNEETFDSETIENFDKLNLCN